MSDFLEIKQDLAAAIERELGIKLEADKLHRIADSIRAPRAGDVTHWPTRPRFVLGTTLDLTGSVSEIMRRYSVNKTTVYRWLKQK